MIPTMLGTSDCVNKQCKSGKDHTLVSPAKGHKRIDDHGIRASDTQGKAEKAETVHPGEEKAQKDLVNVYKYLMG